MHRSPHSEFHINPESSRAGTAMLALGAEETSWTRKRVIDKTGRLL